MRNITTSPANIRFSISRPTLVLKLLAFFYGLLCVTLTFLVDSIGSGVLQISLTIFGVVGGPLLGLFSLGMSNKRANQKGALVGFILSLSLSLWYAKTLHCDAYFSFNRMGFGQPRPRATQLPRGIDTCPQGVSNVTTPMTQEEPHYFYLYTISYAWFALIGFLITLIIGFVASLPFEEERNVHPDLVIQWKSEEKSNADEPNGRIQLMNMLSE